MLWLFWIQNARIEIFPHPHFQKKMPSLSLNYSRATQPLWKAPGYNFQGFSTKCPHPRQPTPATPLISQRASPAAGKSLHLINPLSCLSFPNELGSSWVHKDSNSKHGALGHSPGQWGHDSEVTHSHSQTSPNVTFVHNTNIPEPSGQMTYSAGPCPGAPGMPPKSDSTPVLPRDLSGQASLRSALEVLVFL